MRTYALRAARQKRGLTQEALAELAGVDQTTISRLEIGSYANPTLDTQERLAKALGLAPSELRFAAPKPLGSVSKTKDREGHTSKARVA